MFVFHAQLHKYFVFLKHIIRLVLCCIEDGFKGGWSDEEEATMEEMSKPKKSELSKTDSDEMQHK